MSLISQKLCKRHPTLLGLCSRCLPDRFKPAWLKRYDRWYVMADQDYEEVFEVPYLSGCCMLVRSDAFRRVGGFDERYFLYLEDADITRSLAHDGKCVHLPVAAVVHNWGRGNYQNLRLMLVNIISAWRYLINGDGHYGDRGGPPAYNGVLYPGDRLHRFIIDVGPSAFWCVTMAPLMAPKSCCFFCSRSMVLGSHFCR